MQILELGGRRILRSGNSSRLSMDRRVTSRADSRVREDMSAAEALRDSQSEGDIVNEVGVKLMGIDGVDGANEVDGVDGVEDGSQSEA
jgi:hypothetical protein